MSNSLLDEGMSPLSFLKKSVEKEESEEKITELSEDVKKKIHDVLMDSYVKKLEKGKSMDILCWILGFADKAKEQKLPMFFITNDVELEIDLGRKYIISKLKEFVLRGYLTQKTDTEKGHRQRFVYEILCNDGIPKIFELSEYVVCPVKLKPKKKKDEVKK